MKKKWIVVASDSQARFYEQSVPKKDLHLLACWMAGSSPTSPHKSTSSLHKGGGLDYCHDVSGPYQVMDRLSRIEFIKRVSQHLNESVKKKEVQELCLVAPPDSLEELLQHLNSSTCSCVYAKVARKLTDVPPDQLPTMLEEIL